MKTYTEMTNNTNKSINQLFLPTVKMLLAVGGLLFIRFLLSLLPFLDSDIPETELTYGSIVGALLMLALIGAIANFGREIESQLQLILTGSGELTADIANGIKFLIFFVCVLIAYYSFIPLAQSIIQYVPSLGIWAYDLGFLILAAIPLGVFVYRMAINLDAIADALTDQIYSSGTKVTCSNCGSTVSISDDFCPSCGRKLVRSDNNKNQSIEDATDTCPNCGSKLNSCGSYCGTCGAEISS